MKLLVAPATVKLNPDQPAANPPAPPAPPAPPEAVHVRVAVPSSAGMPTQAITPAPVIAAAPPTAALPVPAPRRRWLSWVLAGVIVMVLGGGLLWLTQGNATQGLGATATPAADRPTAIPIVVAAVTPSLADLSTPTSPAPPTPTLAPAATATSEPAIEPTPAPIIVVPTATLAPPTDAPTAVPAPTSVPLSADLQQVVDLINEQRELQGLARLSVHPQLVAAAQAHSDDMAANNFFSNTGSDGSDPKTRINRAGYIASLSIENIAAGYATPLEVVASWMNDDGQRANLLNPDARDIGPGYAANPTSQYGRYWTIVYAKP
jgi:uncharacterized protein YkwD